jgi:hypothetical protein
MVRERRQVRKIRRQHCRAKDRVAELPLSHRGGMRPVALLALIFLSFPSLTIHSPAPTTFVGSNAFVEHKTPSHLTAGRFVFSRSVLVRAWR